MSETGERRHPGAYDAAGARNLNILKECTKHMIPAERALTWPLERCMRHAKRYDRVKDWQNGSRGSYDAAFRNKKAGWLEKCSAHMVREAKPKNWWTKERCIKFRAAFRAAH